MGVPETTQGSKEIPPYKQNTSMSREVPIEKIFPEKEIENEKVRYWRDLATTRHIALQNCNKGLNRLNRQSRRLKREKAELAVIMADQLLTIQEGRNKK